MIPVLNGSVGVLYYSAAGGLSKGLLYQSYIETESPAPIIVSGSTWSIAAKHSGDARVWTIRQIADLKNVFRLAATAQSSLAVYNPPGTAASTLTTGLGTTPSDTWIYITYEGTTVAFYGPSFTLIGTFGIGGWGPFTSGLEWTAAGVAGSSINTAYIWQGRVLSASDASQIEAGWTP